MKTDSEIQRQVIEELEWVPDLKGHQIGVSVKNAVVTLNGRVDSYAKKIAAEKATKKVSGVKALAEQISVSLNHKDAQSDTDIAEAVVLALKWHSAMREDKIKVKVESGIVTLEGDVDWDQERNSANYMVANIKGVKGLVNTLKVKPKTSPAELKEMIKKAFKRNAQLDANKISIELVGDKAIVKGFVRTWVEKEEAEKVIWRSPGILSVENKLEINTELAANE